MIQTLNPPVILVMGVSGCGKTTIGRALAQTLNAEFLEGDSFHKDKDIAKMSKGTPLTDTDRLPWLEAIAKALRENVAKGRTTVLACSALKRAYRDILFEGIDNHRIVYLKVPEDVLRKRVSERKGHYMPPSLLPSQLATLEEPAPGENAITVPSDESVELTLATVMKELLQSGYAQLEA